MGTRGCELLDEEVFISLSEVRLFSFLRDREWLTELVLRVRGRFGRNSGLFLLDEDELFISCETDTMFVCSETVSGSFGRCFVFLLSGVGRCFIFPSLSRKRFNPG